MPDASALFGVFVYPINGGEIVIWDGEARVVLGIPVVRGLGLIAIFKVDGGGIVQEGNVVGRVVRVWVSATTATLLEGRRNVAIVGG